MPVCFIDLAADLVILHPLFFQGANLAPHLDLCHSLACLAFFIYIRQHIPFESVRSVAGYTPLYLFRGHYFPQSSDGGMSCAAVPQGVFNNFPFFPTVLNRLVWDRPNRAMHNPVHLISG
jgi:hypothetical protein